MTNEPLHEKGKTINITKDYAVDYEPVEKNAFAKFIREKRKEYNDDNGEELSTKDLGEMIGIKYEMFRKILNQEKPTKKRDCIIAICVALQLPPDEIDEALGLYQYMPALEMYNPRDRFIDAQISGDTHISVQELNNRLIQRGFPGLDVQDKRDGKVKSTETKAINLPYKVKEMKVRTPVDADYYYGDQYNSLCTTYDPVRCKSTGDMILEDPKRKKYIHLIADTEGYRSVQDDILPKSFDSLEETGDYKNYFIELENAIRLEKQRLLCVLNDTKNYRSRTSARLIDDAITVFTEQFNYTIPELNEYYVVSLCSGRYRLYVYDRSAFMSWYLSEKTFKTCFGDEIPVAKETYDSLEDLQKLIDESDKRSDSYIHYRMLQRAFKKMIPDVDSLYQEIKDRKEFIQNLGYIFDNPADVLRYYELCEDFECRYDDEYDEYGEICDCLDSKLYPLPDGTEIQITMDDIYKAFEFGFSDIQEICRIKSKYGSIEAVLK